MKKIMIGLGIMLVSILTCYLIFFFFYSRKIEVKLSRCIDGDTVEVFLDGEKKKIRLLGVDTPEISFHKNEEYGNEALEYTCSLLKKSRHIYLEYDRNSNRYDKYGRTLGWLFVDEGNLSELLVKNGYAKVRYIYGDYQYLDNLCSLQREAYSKKLRVWRIRDDYSSNYCMKNGLTNS